VRAFARWGWNEGRHESFTYTEVNRSTSGGGEIVGRRWSRHNDKIGVAVIVNELSPEHREYLAAGGVGFLLGDGKLTYGSERILETYYTARLARGIFGSFDLQWINNPGYNQDRGPVVVPGARLHLEF
jgi:high affinity Mn2+ porin